MSTLSSRLMRRSLVVLLALAASGCAVSRIAPSTVTGTWVGTVTSSILGTEAFQLTLTQSGSDVSGFFTGTIPGQSTSFSGPVTGTLQGSAFSAVLPTGTCTRTWTGSLSGTTLSGTFAATGTCGNLDSGTFSVTLE